MKHMNLLLLMAVTATCWFAGTATADDWPFWQGPHHNSTWTETDIIDDFPDEGPTIKWRIPVNAGYTGPSVADGRVYLMDRIVHERTDDTPQGVIPGLERVLCLNASNGEIIWEYEYDSNYKISYPEGPRASPIIEGDRVWTLGAMGHLHCFNCANGDVIWESQLAERFECEPPAWGFAATPRIDGDRIYCVVGGEGSALVALNKTNGETIWESLDAEETGYAPPVIYGEGAERQLIFWHDVAVNSVDPESGELLWSVKTPDVDAPSRPVVTIVTPRFEDDLLYVSDFYNGSTMIRVLPNREGAEVVWRDVPLSFPFEESLNILMTTPVFKDGHVYSISGSGQSRCILAKDGTMLWNDKRPFEEERMPNFATVFYVENGDRTFMFTDKGDLMITSLTPEGMEIHARANILEPVGFARGRDVVWSHPAFSGRCMFARNDDEIVCVDLAK